MAEGPGNSEANSVLDNIVVNGDFDQRLLLTHSNRVPMEAEVSLIKTHLEEDMRELEALNARIEVEADKVAEKTKLITELRGSLEAIKHENAETSRQLKIELDTQTAFEQLSREYARTVASSAFLIELLPIYSEFAERSESIIGNSTRALQISMERELETISQLESSLKVEHACLGLIIHRKQYLETNRDDLLGSIAETRALMGWTRRLPPEILVQIFLTTLDLFIHKRIQAPFQRDRNPSLTITGVCTEWRDIAMNTAELWGYIPIYGSPLLPPVQIKILEERARKSGDLFIDFPRLPHNQNDDQMDQWEALLGDIGRHVDLTAKQKSGSDMSLHFSCTAPVPLNVGFLPLKKYIFYNIYPKSTAKPASHVTSIILHFNQRPKKQPLLDILQQFPNLTNFEVHLSGFSHLQKSYNFGLPSCLSLQRLSVRLSLMPYFLSDRHTFSRNISALTIHCDQPSSHTFITPGQWNATVRLGQFGRSLRYLGLEGPLSTADTTSHAVPLLVGLQNVATLALRGNFMAPILEVLTLDNSLLPILRRVEMRSTDIGESVIENLLNSRRGSGQQHLVSLREVVFDRCKNITRDFCDRVRGKIDSLTVYC